MSRIIIQSNGGQQLEVEQATFDAGYFPGYWYVRDAGPSGSTEPAVLDQHVAVLVPAASGSATAAALRAAYVPFWAPAETVTAGAVRMTSLGLTITRNANGTTRGSFDATEAALWTVVSGGGGSTGAAALTPTTTKTAAYTVAVGEMAVMNVAGGATALTLPTAPADKSQVGFRAVGATTAVPLVVTRGGTDTIGDSGATSVSLPLAGEVTIYQYQAAGTRWLPVGNVKPLAGLDGRFDAAGAATSAQTAALAAIAGTSHQVRALAAVPVSATPPTIALETSSAALSGATSTVTGTLMTPNWAASTFYPAGAAVLHPTDTNTVIVRTAQGTSRASYDATETALWTSAPQGTQVNYPARYNCAFLRQRTINASNEYGPRPSKRVDGTEETAAQFESIWSVDFDWYTAAGAFEIPVYDKVQLRVIIDGQYASATPTQLGANNFAWQYVKVAGVAAGYHRVRIEIGGPWSSIGGIKLATGDAMYPPTLPATKRFVILGDSFAEGYTGTAGQGSAAPDLRGYAAQLARILGFSTFFNASTAATGFTTTANQAYPARIPDVVALAPDYLFVQGSSNESAGIANLPTLAQSALTSLRTQLPNTKIALSGAMNLAPGSDTITPILQTAAAATGVDFVDTTGWNVLSVAAMNADGTHPTPIGHEYLARRLATALAALWKLSV